MTEEQKTNPEAPPAPVKVPHFMDIYRMVSIRGKPHVLTPMIRFLQRGQELTLQQGAMDFETNQVSWVSVPVVHEQPSTILGPNGTKPLRPV